MNVYSEEDLYQIFTDFEVKVTPHRLSLLRHMSKSKLPIATSRIVEQMKKKEDVDQATVYRNLTVLFRSQVLNKVDINGQAHYEMNFGENAIILACTKCGAIDKVQKINIDDIIKKANKQSRKFATLNHINMRLYGLCKSCMK